MSDFEQDFHTLLFDDRERLGRLIDGLRDIDDKQRTGQTVCTGDTGRPRAYTAPGGQQIGTGDGQ